MPVATGSSSRPLWSTVQHALLRAALAVALAASAAPAQADVTAEIHAQLAAGGGPPGAEAGSVRRFYETRDYQPAFLAGKGLTPAATAALDLLAASPTRGLPPSRYDVAALTARARALEASGWPDHRAAARFDIAVARALVRYFLDASRGRVAPSSLGLDLRFRPRHADVAAAIATGLEHADLESALVRLEPRLDEYSALLAALARYRSLARDPPPLAPRTIGNVAPGDRYREAAALRARLIAFGDLPRDTPTPLDARYDDVLAAGVARFQARVGLEPDRILGPATFAALAVPPAQRVRQIELALERLRWLPEPPAEPFLLVNVPEFKLWAFDGTRGARAAVLEMNVIVGREGTRTPVFADRIEYVEFNPAWNVPRSIAAKEIYPAMVRDPSYLDKQDMVLIGANGLAADALRAALASGVARIMQRPGPRNALGRVKFGMLNRHDVYLHDTPTRPLFARARRDFSHGCIRVEAPVALARFLLAGQPEWDETRIRAAMAGGATVRATPSQTVPVLIFYTTAAVGRDGTVRFAPDIYGLDAALERALAAR